MTRSVVVCVVGGGSVSDDIETEVAAYRLERFEQLLFAVKAAIRIVARVCLHLDLIRGDLDEPRAQLPREDARLLLLRLGIRRGARQDGDGALAELIERELQQQGGIDAA